MFFENIYLTPWLTVYKAIHLEDLVKYLHVNIKYMNNFLKVFICINITHSQQSRS